MFEEHNIHQNANYFDHDGENDPLVRFYNDCNELTQIESTDPDQVYNLRKALACHYILEDRVKKDANYVKLWLSLADFIKDQEEVFVYMYNNGIGDRDQALYQKWVNWYAEKKQFIYADQLIQLGMKKCSTSKWVGAMNYLQDRLNTDILSALVSDVYSKPYYKKHVSAETQREADSESDGISLEDYEYIKSINLSTRINDVVARIYSTSLIENDSNFVLNNEKQKSVNMDNITRRRNRLLRKKYSDLVNTKEYTNGVIYVERDYRNIISSVTMVAMEYEYLLRLYKDFAPIVDYQDRLDPSKREFWVKEEKRQELKRLSLGRKIARIRPRPSKRSQVSSGKKRISKNSASRRSINRHSSSKKENVNGYANRADVIMNMPKLINFEDLDDIFDVKRESDSFFSQQPTNANTYSNPPAFFNMGFNMRLMETPFSMFNNDVSSVKVLKMRTVDVRENICKELPRMETNVEVGFN